MKGGTGNGLEIMLDIQQDEYLPVWGETGTYPTQGPFPWFLASASTRAPLCDLRQDSGSSLSLPGSHHLYL
jgi:hypothetical protein